MDGDDRPDLNEPAALTNADGTYTLSAPGTGTYAIREVLTPGYLQTFPLNGEHLITPNTPRPLVGINFGNQPARDYGDLPLPYLTTEAAGGASHGYLAGLNLGATIDIDLDGVPSLTARGDDTAGVDDEDGVKLAAPLVVGATDNKVTVNVTNTTGSTAYLQGWMDFNGDGDFNDAFENIIPNRIAVSGDYTFTIPATAIVGNVYSRFRLSQTSGIGPNGRAVVGEVEDYRFQTLPVLQYTNPDRVFAARNSDFAANVFDVLANDPIRAVEGFTAKIVSVTNGSRGGLATTDGNFVRYKPALGFVGTEVVRYTVEVSNGVFVTETITIRVDFSFATPNAIDDSFEVTVNSPQIALNVLGNDVEGQGGEVFVNTGTITTSSGGTAVRSPNGKSILYKPAAGFQGTETFTYSIVDSIGDTSTAQATVHVIPGDRDDDTVQFSVRFRNLAGQEINQIVQGQQFLVDVIVTDLRSNPTAPAGALKAYLDLLYNSDFVLPAASTGNSPFTFDVQFDPAYSINRSGNDALPGLINELGATSATNASLAQFTLATLKFDARTAGYATFFPNAADLTPANDVVFKNTPATSVPEILTRYLRSTIEVISNVAVFPQAVDDSPVNVVTVNSAQNPINVLRNDAPGANGPLQIVRVTQPASGSVSIDERGTPTPTDDLILFNAGATSGIQTFTYTIIDGLGYESTANVTVQVGNQTADVQLRLEATDMSGAPIASVNAGSPFQLRGYVKDLRTNAAEPGIFAAFQDILLSDPTLARIVTSNNALGFDITFSNDYSTNVFINGVPVGDIRVPGLINEVGSQQTNTNNGLGTSERLQFVINLVANSRAGSLTFTGDPADIPEVGDTLFFDTLSPVDKARIDYTNVTINIVNANGTGSGEGQSNLLNALDANNDGRVSTLDLLVVVNELNARTRTSTSTLMAGEGEATTNSTRRYPDTNGDGSITLLDLLAVINYLNGRGRQTSPSGEGPSNSTGSTAVTDSAFEDFADNGVQSIVDAVADDVTNAKKSGTRL